MTIEEAEALVEMSVATLEGSGRKSREYGGGASNVTACWEPSWTEVKGVFEDLGGWIRRKLRCILWRQWKRSFTLARNLIRRGLTEQRAWRSARNGRGPWWNLGASNMHDAFRKSFFDNLGLVSLLDHLRRFQCAS